MLKTKIKKISMIALAGVMSFGMMVGTFDLSKVKADTYPSPEKARITVEKTLTINGKKFPDVSYFEFKLTAMEGYHNEHDTNHAYNVDGLTIAAENVPMPNGSSTTEHSIKLNVGDFKDSSNDTPSNNPTCKVRRNSFGDITYTKAGYYLYKLEELGSKKNSTSDTSTSVPGAYYDTSTYWVVVYVVNNVDNATDRNTTTGVHVESVTAWHNEKGAIGTNDEKKPNLKDIAAYGYSNRDNNTGDNNGNAANPNTKYGQNQTAPNSNPPSTPHNDNLQRWDNLGKVGISHTPTATDPNNANGDGRNVLDAYKYWNRQEMHDIALTENVVGNLGDKTKDFEYTFTLNGLEPGNEYIVEKTGGFVQNSLPTLFNPSDGTTIYNNIGTDTTKGKIVADTNGTAMFEVKLSDDQKINLVDIPNTAKYQATEKASNHIPSFTITGTGTTPTIVKPNGNTNNAKETALSTSTKTLDNTLRPEATEVVENADGNVTIKYINTRDLETITGIPNPVIYFGVAGLVAIIALIAMRRRKDNGLVEL